MTAACGTWHGPGGPPPLGGGDAGGGGTGLGDATLGGGDATTLEAGVAGGNEAGVGALEDAFVPHDAGAGASVPDADITGNLDAGGSSL